MPASNYSRILLKLCDGQIIDVASGEVVINLSQFIATKEPSESENTSILSSQMSPRLLHIDSEYVTSTQEDNHQQEALVDDVIVIPSSSGVATEERGC